MMHQSEFDAANVALSRAADKRKSLINIHKNLYTATLKFCYSVNFVRLKLMAGDRVYSTRETVAISSCVWGYHIYKDRWKPRIGENFACVPGIYNIKDRYAVAVVKNQDHVDAIENDRLPCGFGNTLRSAQMLEVFLDRHLLSSSMWRLAREMYGIIIFGLVQIFVDLTL